MRIPARTLTLEEMPLLIGRDAVRLPPSCGACGRPVRVDIDLDRRIIGVRAYRHPPTGALGEIACGHCQARPSDIRDLQNEEAARAL